MAPIVESVVDDLKAQIQRLEGRIAELEGKSSPNTVSADSEKGVRMILIGPPGAGELLVLDMARTGFLTWMRRQGNPGSQDQGEVLRLPSGMFNPVNQELWDCGIWGYRADAHRLPVTCSAPRSQRRRRSAGKPRRSWMPAASSAMRSWST